MKILRLLLFCLLVLAGLARATESTNEGDDVIYNDEVVVFRSVELAYPRLASAANVQGIVVVKLTLNDEGDVVSAAALSGPKLLIEPSVANAKRWAFKPTLSKTVVLLYDFRFEETICKSAVSFYALRPPNVPVITACREPAVP